MPSLFIDAPAAASPHEASSAQRADAQGAVGAEFAGHLRRAEDDTVRTSETAPATAKEPRNVRADQSCPRGESVLGRAPEGPSPAADPLQAAPATTPDTLPQHTAQSSTARRAARPRPDAAGGRPQAADDDSIAPLPDGGDSVDDAPADAGSQHVAAPATIEALAGAQVTNLELALEPAEESIDHDDQATGAPRGGRKRGAAERPIITTSRSPAGTAPWRRDRTAGSHEPVPSDANAGALAMEPHASERSVADQRPVSIQPVSPADATAATPAESGPGAAPLEADSSTTTPPDGAAPDRRAPAHRLASTEGPSGAPAGRSTGMPEVERFRMIQRVARAFHLAAQREGVVRLRLSPPQLGSLRLELRLREGAMTARLTAETETVRAILIDSLPELRERLARQDVHVEQFDVDVQDEPRRGSSQASAEDGRDAASHPGSRGTRTTAAPAAEADSSRAAGAVSPTGRLNVVI